MGLSLRPRECVCTVFVSCPLSSRMRGGRIVKRQEEMKKRGSGNVFVHDHLSSSQSKIVHSRGLKAELSRGGTVMVGVADPSGVELIVWGVRLATAKGQRDRKSYPRPLRSRRPANA